MEEILTNISTPGSAGCKAARANQLRTIVQQVQDWDFPWTAPLFGDYPIHTVI